MPPKQQANKKTVEKQKQKIIEDKTFGLKNKKGAKQQKFIQQVEKQVKNKGQPQVRRDVLDPAAEREKRKEEEKKKKEELSMLFKPVITQTVAKGVDPKSVVCVFFKQGMCQKGDKCKFSHDLAKERQTEKRSIYEDTREEEDTMDTWDTNKLADVVDKKHGEQNKANATQIVCKYFIEAVENSTYGWFWVCPNEKDGGRCIYRHALPPGFQLKSDKKKEDKEEIALETLIETERAGLGQNVTKVTLESFLAWKARKIQEKKDKANEQEEKKKKDFKLGFLNGLTGRDIFTFNPDLIANDDEEAENDIDYHQRVDDDGDEVGEAEGGDGTVNGETVAAKKAISVREVDAAYLASLAKEAVATAGTIATADRFDYIKDLIKKPTRVVDQDEGKLDMACGGSGEVEDVEDKNFDEDENGKDGDEDDDEENDDEDNDGDDDDGDKKQAIKTSGNSKTSSKANNIEIDESLFTLEDLGNIQDELENLDI